MKGARRCLNFAAALLLVAGSCMPPVEAEQARAADASNGELSVRLAPSGAPEGEAETGLQRIGQGASLYVPRSYRHGEAMPLVVMLHGAGGAAEHSISLARGHADRLGFLLLAPQSRGASWDIISRRAYGADVRAIDAAIREVAAGYSVDPKRVAVGGFSDGASYALSLGLINGELFSDILAFSPGFTAVTRASGKPAIYISHGVKDRVLPIDMCSRRIVPQLKSAGYEVRYVEFPDGHTVPEALAREAFERL